MRAATPNKCDACLGRTRDLLPLKASAPPWHWVGGTWGAIQMRVNMGRTAHRMVVIIQQLICSSWEWKFHVAANIAIMLVQQIYAESKTSTTWGYELQDLELPPNMKCYPTLESP